MVRDRTDFVDWLDALVVEPVRRGRAEEQLQRFRLAQDLVALREARELTQAQLARRLGVSQPVVARIEAGRVTNLQLRTHARIAAALGGTVRLRIQKAVARQPGPARRMHSPRKRRLRKRLAKKAFSESVPAPQLAPVGFSYPGVAGELPSW